MDALNIVGDFIYSFLFLNECYLYEGEQCDTYKEFKLTIIDLCSDVFSGKTDLQKLFFHLTYKFQTNFSFQEKLNLNIQIMEILF